MNYRTQGPSFAKGTRIMASSLQDPSPTPTEPSLAPQRLADPAVPPALSAPPSLETLVHALRRRWVTALSCGLLVGLLGAAVAWYIVPAQYTAQTLLQISPRALHNGDGEEGVLTYQRTQSALVKSYTVIQGTLERPNIAELVEVREKSDPTEWLSKSLLTDSLLGPEIIRVTLSGDRAEDVAVILNELTRVYMKASAAKEEGKIMERMKQMKENYREVAEKLRERRQTLLIREEEAGVDDPDTVRLRQTTTMQQLAALQQQRVQLQLRRKETQIELDGLRERVKNPESILISEFAIAEELKQDPVMKKHFDRLTEIEGQLQKLRRLVPPGTTSPDLQNYDKERANVLKAMEEYHELMAATTVARLRSRQVAEAKESVLRQERTMQFVNEQERSLDSEIKRLEGLISSLRGVGRPLDKNTTGVEALRDEVLQLEMVLKKVGEELGNLQTELPTARKRDRQFKAAGAAGFGLFGLVFLGIGLLEFRNRRVYTSEDVARGLGLNLLGTLPQMPEQARNIVAAANAASPPEQDMLTEAVDSVRTQLLHLAYHERRKVVMVTSAVAGEGKTSLAGHLAASLARAGHKTLLIDGDLRNPAVHRRFGLPAEPGLAEALRGQTPAEQLLRVTPVENLTLLTAGRCDRQAIQKLSRDGMQKVLQSLQGDYEFVILDVCPVLPVADALLIGQHADAVVLAVLRNFSRLPLLFEAQRRLASLDIPMLGAVVLGESSDRYGVERYLSDMKQ
jgi:capsular exopolysaccharide synthesis family protein